MEAIKAIIWLKPTKEGGRISEFTAGWCPHLCVAHSPFIHDEQPVYMGVRVTEVLQSDSSNWIAPGESGEVNFALMYFDSRDELSVELYRPLNIGSEFEIREGGKIVGVGCVQSRSSD